MGDPMGDRTTLGQLSSIAARDNLAGQVERAVAHGARVHLGGRAVSGPGAFYAPRQPGLFRGIFWTGRPDLRCEWRRVSGRAGQRLTIWPRELDLLDRHRSRETGGSADRNRRGVDQHDDEFRARAALWRREALRLWSRTVRTRNQGVHQPQVGPCRQGGLTMAAAPDTTARRFTSSGSTCARSLPKLALLRWIGRLRRSSTNRSWGRRVPCRCRTCYRALTPAAPNSTPSTSPGRNPRTTAPAWSTVRA